MTLESCFVQVDGVSIHCRKAGSGPALLLVHGLVADGLNWELNVPALVGARTVYALDMPNMGLSARVRYAEAGLAATADWLGRLLDALGLVEADLVGSSQGGAVCLAFAGRYPERVRRMVLFSPANPFCPRPRPLIRFWNSPLGTVAARIIPLLPPVLLDWAHKRVYADQGKAQPCTIEGYRTGLKRQSIVHLRRIVRTWWADMEDLRQRLPVVARVPILLIWGERDRVVSAESGARLARELEAQIIVLPNVGHLPFAESTAASNRAMTGWLFQQEET